MNTSIFIWLIYAFWTILIVYLVISARSAKQDTKGHPWQSFGLLFAIMAAFLLPRVPVFHFLNFAPVTLLLSIIGLILCVAGMAFFVWARQNLGRNWSQTVSAKEGQKLITSGPYRLVRHPMYTGGFIAAIGSAIVCGGGWIFLILFLGVIFLWRAGAEDRLMAQQFPDEYSDYMNRTKKLIPFIW